MTSYNANDRSTDSCYIPPLACTRKSVFFLPFDRLVIADCIALTSTRKFTAKLRNRRDQSRVKPPSSPETPLAAIKGTGKGGCSRMPALHSKVRFKTTLTPFVWTIMREGVIK